MRNGEIDFAFLTPYTYLKAEARNPTIELFATYRLNGSELYRSIIVWERRDAESLDDLLQELKTTSGKLALVHEFSTSGYIWPENWLRQRGIEISALHTHMNSEAQATHTAALQELIRNDPNADTLAAAVWEGAYEAFLQDYKGEPLQTYYIPPLIPNDPFVRRSGLPMEIRDAMESALLNMDGQLGEVMVADGFQRWVRTQGCTYDPVRAFTGTPARPTIVDLAFQEGGDGAFRTLIGRVEWDVVGGARGEKTVGTGLLWVWLAFSWALYSSVGGGLLRCFSFVTRCHTQRVFRHWQGREWRRLGWDGLGATWNAAKCIGPGLVATPLLCLMVLLTSGFWDGTPFAQMPPPLQIVVGTCCGYFGWASLGYVTRKIV